MTSLAWCNAGVNQMQSFAMKWWSGRQKVPICGLSTPHHQVSGCMHQNKDCGSTWWQDSSPASSAKNTLSLSSSHRYCQQQPWSPGKQGSWRINLNLSHLVLQMGLCSSLTTNNLMVFCLHNVVWQYQMVWIFDFDFEYVLKIWIVWLLYTSVNLHKATTNK